MGKGVLPLVPSSPGIHPTGPDLAVGWQSPQSQELHLRACGIWKLLAGFPLTLSVPREFPPPSLVSVVALKTQLASTTRCQVFLLWSPAWPASPGPMWSKRAVKAPGRDSPHMTGCSECRRGLGTIAACLCIQCAEEERRKQQLEEVAEAGQPPRPLPGSAGVPSTSWAGQQHHPRALPSPLEAQQGSTSFTHKAGHVAQNRLDK